MKNQLFQASKAQQYCPQCGAPLQIKQGKKGLFLGCSAFPQCDYLKPLSAQHESKVLKDLAQTCPECGHFLQVKQGHFGLFIGCSHYPQCHFIVHEQAQPEQQTPQHFACPDCQQGELVARRGRQGKTFYGCNRFPHCKFTLPAQPQEIDCPKCHGRLGYVKKQAENHRTLVCANKACKHSFTE